MQYELEDYTIIANRPGKKYGVTEVKKAELDRLKDEVLDAELKVEQCQASVTALTAKLDKFTTFYATADANRTIALNNWNTIKTVRENAKNLVAVSKLSLSGASVANERMSKVAFQINKVVEELIYTVESINKLSVLINRKKAKNPLISDELISVMGTTGKDANSAVALMLTALKSTFAAHASALESDETTGLAFYQSTILYDVLTGEDNDPKQSKEEKEKEKENSLVGLLHQAYLNAEAAYERYKKALSMTNTQLDDAKAEFTKAETKLTSLQAGYSAAQAAALAS